MNPEQQLEAKKLAWFTDRDGTIGPLNGDASEAVIETINYMHTAGRGVGIVSIRGERRALQDSLNLRLPLIVEAGGAARFPEGIRTFPMTLVERAEVANAFLQATEKVTYAAFYPKDEQGDSQAFIFARSEEAAEKFRSNPKLQGVIRENGIITSPEKFAELLASMDAEICMVEMGTEGEVDILPRTINHTTADGVTIVTAQGINKGTTVMAVAELLRIPENALIVSGDQPVDQPMLDAVSDAGGISIAVGNPSLQAMYHVNKPEDLGTLVEQIQSAQYTMTEPIQWR